MYLAGRDVASGDRSDQEAAQVQGAEEEAGQVTGKGQGEGRQAEEEAAFQVSPRVKHVDLLRTWDVRLKSSLWFIQVRRR